MLLPHNKKEGLEQLQIPINSAIEGMISISSMARQ